MTSIYFAVLETPGLLLFIAFPVFIMTYYVVNSRPDSLKPIGRAAFFVVLVAFLMLHFSVHEIFDYFATKGSLDTGAFV